MTDATSDPIILSQDADLPSHVVRGYWASVWNRLKYDYVTLFCLALIILIVLSAIFAPWLAPYDPEKSSMAYRLKPIGHPKFILGSDEQGRDILSRVLHGARVSLTVGFAAPAIGVGIGLALGLVAGYFRGWVDEVVGVLIDAWLAIPGLAVLLLFSAVFGGSLSMVCLSLGLLFIPAAARITRAQTLSCANREFVLAARAMGASDTRGLLLGVLFT